MSRPDRSNLTSLLLTGAERLGYSLTAAQVDLFLEHLSQLKQWNRRINLTRIASDAASIEKHFLDSLAGLKAIEPKTGLMLLDIGTGAGFPGIPLKIALPEVRLTLLESSQKKAAFLHHLCGVLKLKEITILHQRLEELIGAPARFDRIVARAVAKPQFLIDPARRLLHPDGKLILYMGRPSVATAADRFEGWAGTIPYELPFSKTQRRLEIFRSKG